MDTASPAQPLRDPASPQASLQLPDLQYYYMGYYIHSCPKMRYKADYSPSGARGSSCVLRR